MNYITKLRKKNPVHNIPKHYLKMTSEERMMQKYTMILLMPQIHIQ